METTRKCIHNTQCIHNVKNAYTKMHTQCMHCVCIHKCIHNAYTMRLLLKSHFSRSKTEGKSWKGVVEAAAEVRLMILAHSRLLIYHRRLEEWQFGCFPGLWSIELRAYGRAEESSGTQEGVVTYHAIAGKMCRSHLACKVKVHARLAWWQT